MVLQRERENSVTPSCKLQYNYRLSVDVTLWHTHLQDKFGLKIYIITFPICLLDDLVPWLNIVTNESYDRFKSIYSKSILASSRSHVRFNNVLCLSVCVSVSVCACVFDLCVSFRAGLPKMRCCLVPRCHNQIKLMRFGRKYWVGLIDYGHQWCQIIHNFAAKWTIIIKHISIQATFA